MTLEQDHTFVLNVYDCVKYACIKIPRTPKDNAKTPQAKSRHVFDS